MMLLDYVLGVGVGCWVVCRCGFWGGVGCGDLWVFLWVLRLNFIFL